jgi:hypothetical protein
LHSAVVGGACAAAPGSLMASGWTASVTGAVAGRPAAASCIATWEAGACVAATTAVSATATAATAAILVTLGIASTIAAQVSL